MRKAFQTLIEKPVYLIVFFSAFALGTVLIFFPSESRNLRASVMHADEAVELAAFPVVEPNLRYGFALDTFQVAEGDIQPGSYLGELLKNHGVDYATIDQLARNARDVFDVKDIRVGKPYTILKKDSTESADYFIYEPSVYEYVVFELKEDLKVWRQKRKIDTQIRTAGGTIESSLWNAMVDNGLSYEITDKMENALQWSIDFHHIQKGDQFRLVFDQHYIEGEEVGVGEVHAAYYKNYDKEFYAVYFEDTENPGYYDLEGRPMNKGFLKAPVKYSRISSHYNLNRYHPILKRVRPHLGTDYAAPYGTEIYAVGDGVVSRASYTKGNGNFVKIRHDGTYETQYLHMQKFASGIKPGVHVRQGDVIGYVGSTGLATGPHVCFRFWKNGRQVNHLRLSFPPPEPLPADDMPLFEAVRDSLMEMLMQAPVQPVQEQLSEVSVEVKNVES